MEHLVTCYSNNSHTCYYF